MPPDESAQIRRTAIHEAGHAVIGERLGIRIANATAVPDRDGSARGSVRVAGLRPESLDMGVVIAAGHAARKLLDPDYGDTGHERDFQQLEDLARRLRKTEPDLWAEAHARAYQLVREPRITYTIEAVADAIEERAAKGFGMSSAALGAVIAAAHDEYDAKQRLYGQRAPQPTLNGCTPSEELHRRDAKLREIGAATTPRTKAAHNRPMTTKSAKRAKQAPKRKATAAAYARPGFGSKSGYIAIQTFTVTLAGRCETVTAGMTWVCEGHELVRGFPSKFRPTRGHRIDNQAGVPYLAFA